MITLSLFLFDRSSDFLQVQDPASIVAAVLWLPD